ncbi:HAD family hydrolase [bacterium]|nr:HAD family hydrolase [bacterium]
MNQTFSKPAVFLDRDGTLIKHIPYLADPAEVELILGVPKALRTLRDMGLLLVVISNQSGVARGMFTEEDVAATNQRMAELILSEGGPSLDAIYFCPHHPEGIIPEYTLCCNCRKPAPGMIHRAVDELSIDLPRSFLVGDFLASDIMLGLALGLGTIYFTDERGIRPPGIMASTNDFSEIPALIKTAMTERQKERENFD